MVVLILTETESKIVKMLVQMVEGIWRMSLTKMEMEFKIKDDAVSDVFG
jgi:hypothetical protein